MKIEELTAKYKEVIIIRSLTFFVLFCFFKVKDKVKDLFPLAMEL